MMVELKEKSQQELESLYNMIQLSKGTFSISVAIANHPIAVEQITSQLTVENNSCCVHLSEDTQDILTAITQQLESNANCQSIMLTGLTELIKESQWKEKGESIIFQINRTRDAWKEQLPAIPVVLWVNDFIYNMLVSKAHDFWS